MPETTPDPLINPATEATIDAALVSLLGPWGALAALALKFGSPWVGHLISNAQKGVDPTGDEWKALDAKIEIPGVVLIPPRPSA